MHIPNIFKKNNKQAPVTTEWDSLQNIPQANPDRIERQLIPQNPNRRQQKKIEATLLTGDLNYLAATEDIQIDDNIEQDFLNKLSNGEITKQQEQKLLSTIIPFHNPDTKKNNILKIANNEHERKILNWAFDFNNRNPDNFDGTSAEFFFNSFPTPIDFEEREKEMLDRIEKFNGAKKRQEYEQDMENFKLHIFGKRQEYYKQLQYLHEAADAYASKLDDKTEELVDAFTGGKIKDDVNRYEQESISIKSCAVREMSKSQVRGNLEYEPSEDASYHKGNIMAVFDGVGGSENGALASSCCKEALPGIMDSVDFSTDAGKKEVLARLNASITSGHSTCVVTKIIGNQLHYAAIGDSRLYVVTKDGIAHQLTQDDNITPEMLEGSNLSQEKRQHLLDHGISRTLGSADNAVTIPNNNNLGSAFINKGDRIILCTDGITGDTPQDSISTDTIGLLAHRAPDAESVAENLMRSAAKTDDRTVIVAEV